MTEEGRLARGKLNYEAKRFLDNPETLDYVKTLSAGGANMEDEEKKKESEEEGSSEEEKSDEEE